MPPSRSSLPRKSPARKARAREILGSLRAQHPDARCELDHETPYQLLVATILSAQTTDVAVNKVTPALFEACPDPAALAAAEPEDIQPLISSIGLYRNKSRAIVAAMRTVVEDHDGHIPDTMDDLLRLRGVARKTANVVLGNAFGINEGVVVDTHVARVGRRLDLTRHERPEKIERDLMALFPREEWTDLSHLLIFHGRRVCKARGALCSENDLCRAYCANAKAMERKAAPRSRKSAG